MTGRPRGAWVLSLALLAPSACGGGPPSDDLQNSSGDSSELRGAAALPDPRPIPLSGSETPEDWETLAQRVAWARSEGLDTLPLGEAMARVGRSFVGFRYTPYTLEVADPEALVVNLREFDCVTFVESVLAISRLVQSTPATLTDPDQLAGHYASILADFRYRGGQLEGYASRLHYFSEWISDNAARGNLEPVTHLIGGIAIGDSINFMSTHPDSYRQLADATVLGAIQQVEARLNAQPRYELRENRIAQFEVDIQNGDVIAATSTVNGLDVAHTGLALWVDGRLHLMHAPLVGDSVQISEVPLAERIRRIRGQDGIMVARPQLQPLPGTPPGQGTPDTRNPSVIP